MKYHPPRSHPWHKSFNDDANKHRKIIESKIIHYEKTDEDKMKYLNYFKTKRKQP